MPNILQPMLSPGLAHPERIRQRPIPNVIGTRADLQRLGFSGTLSSWSGGRRGVPNGVRHAHHVGWAAGLTNESARYRCLPNRRMRATKGFIMYKTKFSKQQKKHKELMNGGSYRRILMFKLR